MKSLAQLCKITRVPSFFSKSDIAKVFSLRDQHLENFGPGSWARPGWKTTYISAGGILQEKAPELHEKLTGLVRRVSTTIFPGPPSEKEEALSSLSVRCAEVHEGQRGGSLNDPRHFDVGSVVTVDILLSDDFTGGTFTTLEQGGELLQHSFELGDALIFPSYKYHSIQPIQSGVREVLVVEYWHGEEKHCNHRCDVREGDCKRTGADERVPK